MVTRFGDPAGLMASERELLTATPSGAATFADVDGDQRTDAILPTRDGIAASAAPAGVMSPFALALSFGGLAITPHAVIPIDGKRLVIIADDLMRPGFIAGSIIDISSSAPTLTSVQLCDPDEIEDTRSAATRTPPATSIRARSIRTTMIDTAAMRS